MCAILRCWCWCAPIEIDDKWLFVWREEQRMSCVLSRLLSFHLNCIRFCCSSFRASAFDKHNTSVIRAFVACAPSSRLSVKLLLLLIEPLYRRARTRTTRCDRVILGAMLPFSFVLIFGWRRSTIAIAFSYVFEKPSTSEELIFLSLHSVWSAAKCFRKYYFAIFLDLFFFCFVCLYRPPHQSVRAQTVALVLLRVRSTAFRHMCTDWPRVVRVGVMLHSLRSHYIQYTHDSLTVYHRHSRIGLTCGDSLTDSHNGCKPSANQRHRK